MPQPSIKTLYDKSRILSYFIIYLYFIMQCIKITYTNENITLEVTKYRIVVTERVFMLDKKINNRDWKERNKKYLKELQNFFDRADNIKDKDLKQKIIGQMLRCDDILTKIAESRFEEFYKLGYKNAKKE